VRQNDAKGKRFNGGGWARPKRNCNLKRQRGKKKKARKTTSEQPRSSGNQANASSVNRMKEGGRIGRSEKAGNQEKGWKKKVVVKDHNQGHSGGTWNQYVTQRDRALGKKRWQTTSTREWNFCQHGSIRRRKPGGDKSRGDGKTTKQKRQNHVCQILGWEGGGTGGGALCGGRSPRVLNDKGRRPKGG